MQKQDTGVVREIKAHFDIVDIVRRYVDLKPLGGRFVGRCPFHQETKGSFNVIPAEGFYYCFGCQAAGDLIDFYSRINGLDFRETVTQLAEEAGIEPKLFAKSADNKDDKERLLRKVCLEAHVLAAKFYKDNLKLPLGRPAREYLAGRGLSGEICEEFGLGFSPDEWNFLDGLLARNGFDRDAGIAAGLLVKGERGGIYDRFRKRLMFPIRDVSGRVIAFGGRVIGEGDPKYLNSSETLIYKKGDNLYGLYEGRRAITGAKKAFLTEGYMDVITMRQFGFPNACGVLGTALTPSQVKRLSGFCRSVSLVFDGDRAGREAAFKASLMIVNQGLGCDVVALPDGEDVDSYLRKFGAEAFSGLTEKAVDGFDYVIGVVKGQYSPKEIVNWALSFLKGLSDASLAVFYVPKLASGLGLSEQELRQAFRRGADKDKKVIDLNDYREDSEPVKARIVGLASDGISFFEKDVLSRVIRNIDFRQSFADLGIKDTFSSESALAFWEKLQACSDSESEIPTYLDKEEKKLWYEAKSFKITVEWNSKDEIDDIFVLLKRLNIKKKRKKAIEALRLAKERGDVAEEARILEANRDIFSREA